MPDPAGGAKSRALAARIVHGVAFKGRSLDELIAKELPSTTSTLDRDTQPEKNRRLVLELAFGSVRHFFSLRAELARALDKPHGSLDSLVLCLLIIGAYQLRHTRIPGYAAVNETVAATRTLRKPWARALANTVLRRLNDTRLAPDADPDADPDAKAGDEAEYDHPQWLIDALIQDYPEEWSGILEINNQRAPMSLRVNLRHQSRARYREMLGETGIAATPGLPPCALRLDSPAPVARLPGFSDGHLSVQDEGAQLAAELLQPDAGDRVLDACAAPGGKAMHLLETTPDLELLAIESDAERLATLRTECQRLGVDPQCAQLGDATESSWWDGRPFDQILLDAPCTGTGTLRRHPDIKLLKKPTDLAAFATIQRKLLTTLWQTLAPGGVLLYCTCSMLSAENDAVIAAFLTEHDNIRAEPIEAEWGRATRFGRQLLPSAGGPDGFYYARLRKVPDAEG